MSSAGIEAILLEAGISGGTAVVISALLAGLTVVLSTYCASDPPADPVLTATDFINALNYSNPVGSAAAIARIQQWFLRWYWWQVCECSGAATPTQPALTVPTNFDPHAGIPTGPNQLCFDNQGTFTIPAAVHTTTYVDLTPILVPGLGAGVSSSNLVYDSIAGATGLVYPIPPGLQRIDFNFQDFAFDSSYSPSDRSPAIQWNTTDDAGGFVSGLELRQVGTGGAISTAVQRGLAGVWNSSATHMSIAAWQSADVANSVNAVEWIEAIGTCTGAPLQEGCCPTDPAVSQLLAQLVGLVNAIYAGLPTKLHSYAESTVHSGLSGHGTIAIGASAIGVKVSITTDPSYLGSAVGSPTFLFDRGYIVPITNEAPVAGESRLVFNPQLFELPALTDSVGYSLSAGVVITITELTAGP